MKENIIKNIKRKRGFTTADIVISIIIIGVFVGMITTLFYNFYLTSSSKNRNAIALNYIVDVIEETKDMKYDDVTQESVNALINNMNIPKSYTVTAIVQKYNQLEGNLDKIDLIKILNVNVEYVLGNKTEKIEISTLLTK